MYRGKKKQTQGSQANVKKAHVGNCSGMYKKVKSNYNNFQSVGFKYPNLKRRWCQGMHLYVYVNIRAYILTHTLDAVQKSYFLLNIDRLLSLVIVYTIKFIIDERILLAPRSCTFVPNKLPIWNFKDYLLNAFIKYYLST